MTGVASSVKAKKPASSRKTAAHPPTSQLVNKAIITLKERGGSSIQAIKKWIAANNEIDTAKLSPFIKRYLKTAVATGKLVQTKGTGATGSFKLSAAAKAPKIAKKKKKVIKAKKPTVKKVKKTVAKKPAATKRPKTIAVKRKAVAAKKPRLAIAKKPKAAKPKPKKAPTKQKPIKPKAVARKPKAPKPKKAPKKKTAGAAKKRIVKK